MNVVSPDYLVLRRAAIAPFDRGSGVVTLPLVGHWNRADNHVTTGFTTFPGGAGIPLHTHNVEETVLVVSGRAVVRIGTESFDVAAGDATWVPAGVPHNFTNPGHNELTIYWVYAGRQVTRTNCDTGVTVAHLSESDRGATGPLPAAEGLPRQIERNEDA